MFNSYVICMFIKIYKYIYKIIIITEHILFNLRQKFTILVE